MRGILLSILFLGALWSPTTQANNLETCRTYADRGYQMAVRRDQGDSIYAVRAIVVTRFDESIKEVSLILVDHVFKQPWQTPSREAETFTRDCMKVLSGKRTSYTY